MDDDGIPTLSADTLRLLQDFQAEKDAHEKQFHDMKTQADDRFNEKLSMDLFGEDWNASQFWYTDETALTMARQLLHGATCDSAIAVVSTPSVYIQLRNLLSDMSPFERPRLCLLEYDDRFEVLGSDFVNYDFEQPLKLPVDLRGQFDRIICDPPFLSEDCQTKIALTMRYLAKGWPSIGETNLRLIACTGERMEQIITKKLYTKVGVRTTTFDPKHANGLSNEYQCYANFECDEWTWRSDHEHLTHTHPFEFFLVTVHDAEEMASKQHPSKAASTATSSVTPAQAIKNASSSLMKAGGERDPNPMRHGAMGQAERAFSAASTLLSGMMAISASQFIGAPLKLVDHKTYEAYMAWTKESFAVLITTITQWWAPTVVRVSGDASVKGQLFQMPDGTLKCNFPHRIICMANHQLYTDWIYLWWVAYTNKMHGHIYIILKESLKQLPIIGWGAQFYKFIFLRRKWEADRFQFRQALNHLKGSEIPMWLLIFPEGTNLSAVTRDKSTAWAQKTGIPDMKHQLLPRTTGIRFCMQELRKTTNWLYDCTIAYEGVPKGMYGQDIFTLRSSLFEGRPPKAVNMFWRRFKISDIPLDDMDAFTRWLTNRWREKDYMLEYFDKFGVFPAWQPSRALAIAEGRQQRKHAKIISTQVQAGGWDEFLGIFAPITSTADALGSVDLTEPGKLQALMDGSIQPFSGKQLMRATGQEVIETTPKETNKKKPLPNPATGKLLKKTPRTQPATKTELEKSGGATVAMRVSRAPVAKNTLCETRKRNAKGNAKADA